MPDVKSAAIQAGDTLPSPEDLATPGLLVVDVDPLWVEVFDLVFRCAKRWSLYDDGIRVEVHSVSYGGRGAVIGGDWVGAPITKFPPPPAVVVHLRGAA